MEIDFEKPDSCISIIECIDLENYFPGGIDTAITDILKFSRFSFRVIGVTEREIQ